MKTTVMGILLLGLATGRLLQFSNFVPGYFVELPEVGEYGRGQFRNPFDPYIVPASRTTGFGSNIRSELNVQCNPPLRFIKGGCQCPCGGVLIAGICYGGGSCPEEESQEEEQTSFPRQPITSNINPNSISGLAIISRNHNGSNNNLANPLYGSKDSILERRAPAFYRDGIGEPADFLPNARRISNQVGGQVPIFSRDNGTTAFVFFGQFLDHDLDLTTFGDAESFNIPVPQGDEFFSDREYIEFFRSNFVQGPLFREQKNIISAWIDASHIYGNDEESSRFLRAFTDGKLRTSGNNLLPVDNDGLFIAGDSRVNENVILSSYHTLFLREHNRVCDQLKSREPYLNDEEIYQAARHFVIGLFQNLVFEEFLPQLLGQNFQKQIPPYTGYQPNINPNIPTQFSTAGFRFGHALLIDDHPFINEFGITYQMHQLSDIFFRPNVLKLSDTISDVFRGLQVNVHKEKDIRIIDSIRNLLVDSPQQRQVRLDLLSLNIQRGRDHGCSTYNQVRRAFGLSQLRNFQQLLPANDIQSLIRLQSIYQDIDKLDLWMGIIAERSVQNGILGELGSAIVGQTFRNLRDGDRFWFEHAYPQSVIDEIKGTKLADIVRRNTNATTVTNDLFHHFT